MYKIFEKFEKKGKTIPSHCLEVSNFQKVHGYNNLELFKEKFIKIYGAKDPIINELKQYENHNASSHGKLIPEEICFQRKEKNSTSPSHFKMNTYFLCPICDPFEYSHLGPSYKLKYRDGEKVKIDQNQPQFYDTLHAQYEHHLAQVHGVLKEAYVENPFIGFSLTGEKSPVLGLNCICPYNVRGQEAACLAQFKFNIGGKDPNPFKAYLRHVHSCHHNCSNPNGEIYHTQVADTTKDEILYNYFKPLSIEGFMKSLGRLRRAVNGDKDFNPFLLSNDQSELKRIAAYVSGSSGQNKKYTPPTPERSPKLKRAAEDSAPAPENTKKGARKINYLPLGEHAKVAKAAAPSKREPEAISEPEPQQEQEQAPVNVPGSEGQPSLNFDGEIPVMGEVMPQIDWEQDDLMNSLLGDPNFNATYNYLNDWLHFPSNT